MVVRWTVPGGLRSVRRLECVECHRLSAENERGWTARVTVDDDYCPECDEREFGDRGRLDQRPGRWF
jgi:hypothetical protein